MPNSVLTYALWSAGAAFVLFALTRLDTPAPLQFLLIFALVFGALLINLILKDTTEDLAPGTETPRLPAGFGRALLEKMPTALLLINDKGRISYANSEAHALVPRLRAADHFANLFRAPVFVEHVNAVLHDGEERTAVFSPPGQEQVFEAQILRLPPGSDFGESKQVIVQLLDKTQDQRMEQMRADFVANASHELKTPLASIIGYIETLQGHARDDPQARDRFLGIMARQADRMSRLIDDLMSLSRIEMNAHLAPEDVCDIHGIVLEVGAALRPVAEKRNVNLELRLVPGMRQVRGDLDQLAQVATNLIDNAIKYGGGSTVRVFEAPPNEKYPRKIGISIEDQGEGISRSDLHRLTERFYRTNVAQSRNQGGTGLGLAIVKHIVNRHGGELQIESREGHGSRFTFWIPKTETPVKNQADDPTEPAEKHAKTTV